MSIRDLKIERGQKRVEDQRVWVYKGVELSARGRQVLGVDENIDGDQTGIGDVEQASKIVLDELRAMVEQNDSQPVPRNGLVWRCAGDMGKVTASNAVDHLKKRGSIMDGSDGLLPTE